VEGGEGDGPTEELQLLSRRPNCSKTTNQGPLPSQRERYHFTKIRAGFRPTRMLRKRVRPALQAAHVHRRLIAPAAAGSRLSLWPPIHARPRLLPPQSPAPPFRPPRINLAAIDATPLSAIGLEQGHQHHQFSDVQPTEWRLSGPLPAWDGALRLRGGYPMATFPWQALRSAAGKPLPSSTACTDRITEVT